MYNTWNMQDVTLSLLQLDSFIKEPKGIKQ
jgi:hypothetical protein